MLFHINSGRKFSRCGLAIEDIYRDLGASVGLEVQIEKRPNWFMDDHVCLACVQRARPSSPKQIRACRDVAAFQWVVLCGCGGVRPHDQACGLVALPLPPRKARSLT